jgi:glycosyltransferase involved in cell wall biosynthesis
MVYFSIIVPVYNVEDYLKECVESILKQSFNDYEIILVNDGSTDSSGDICDKYAMLSDSNVRVIHKENGGLSDARNVGIENALGSYLIFVDSDDYISKNTLETFYQKLTKSKITDVLITRLMQVYPDGQQKYMDKDIPIDILNCSDKSRVIKWIFGSSQNTWPAPRYIINRNFIKRNKLHFSKGYLHEDVDWTMKLFLHAENYLCVEYYWYAHRMDREGSITTTPNVKRVLDVIELVANNINDSAYKKIDVDMREVMFNRLVSSLYSAIINYNAFDKSDQQKIRVALNNNMDVLEFTSQSKHKLFYLFSKIFGLRLSLRLLKVINKLNK